MSSGDEHRSYLQERIALFCKLMFLSFGPLMLSINAIYWACGWTEVDAADWWSANEPARLPDDGATAAENQMINIAVR